MPGLARGDGVERELYVLVELGLALGSSRLVVDQLVRAIRQAVDAVDAPTQHMGPELELKALLKPEWLGVLCLRALVVTTQCLRRLSVQLTLLVRAAHPAAAPGRFQQAGQ